MMDVLGTSDASAQSIDEDLLGSWWEAAGCSALFAGGVPPLTQFGDINERKLRADKGPRLRPGIGKAHKTSKGRKRCGILLRIYLFYEIDCWCRSGLSKNSLLRSMNNNIAALLRIRRTHRKFRMLNANADSTNAPFPPEPESDHEMDEEAVLREKGWHIQGVVGQTSANECLTWMSSKILQHAGFQGTKFIC